MKVNQFGIVIRQPMRSPYHMRLKNLVKWYGTAVLDVVMLSITFLLFSAVLGFVVWWEVAKLTM